MSTEEAVIAGPYTLFEGSFIVDFRKPAPWRHASVLLHATYKHDHPLCRKGIRHPQVPPLHLHFDQSESFQILQGKVCTRETYAVKEFVWTPENTRTPHEIPPWRPHSFFPYASSTEDCIMELWAHPDGSDEEMDMLFFRNILGFLSDVHEGKAAMDIAQLMLIGHVTASAPVFLPTWSSLGPLRWWVPWKMQAAAAAVARWMGKQPLMEAYTPAADFKRCRDGKRLKET